MNNDSLNTKQPEGRAGNMSKTPLWIVHPKYCPKCGEGQVISESCAKCGDSLSDPDTGKPVFVAGDEMPAEENKPVKHYGFLNYCKISPRKRLISISAMVVILVSSVAAAISYRSSQRSHYLQNYVLALYGIKSGLDMDKRVVEGTYGAWRYGAATAPPGNGIDRQYLADLATVRKEVGDVVANLGRPPAGYEKSAATLERLFTIYDKCNSTLINSPGALALQQSELIAAKVNFASEIENLKTDMPGPLALKFRESGKKYDLRFLGL